MLQLEIYLLALHLQINQTIEGEAVKKQVEHQGDLVLLILIYLLMFHQIGHPSLGTIHRYVYSSTVFEIHLQL